MTAAPAQHAPPELDVHVAGPRQHRDAVGVADLELAERPSQATKPIEVFGVGGRMAVAEVFDGQPIRMHAAATQDSPEVEL